VSPDVAAATVERLADLRLSPLAPSQLVILPGDEGYSLAWRIDTPVDTGSRRVFFVSAADATLFTEYRVPRRPPLAHALSDLAGAPDSAVLRTVAADFGPSDRDSREVGRMDDEFRAAMSRAFVSLVPSGASLALARTACLQSASDLFGADSRAARAVEDYWRTRK
jgi:hypothetical protein